MFTKQIGMACVLTSALVFAVANPLLAEDHFGVTPISIQAVAINNSRTVVVGIDEFWTPANGIQSLSPAPFANANASAISSTGLIAGNVVVPDASPIRNLAAVWNNGQLTTLPVLRNGPTVEENALGINSAGVAVGYDSIWPQTDLRAVRWRNGAVEDLSTLLPASSEGSVARAINNSGQIVITTDPNHNAAGGRFDHAYLLNGTTVSSIVSTEPLTTGVLANSINSLGEITGGVALSDGTAVAFRWQNGVMTLGPTTLGGMPGSSTGSGINDDGKVVGAFFPIGGSSIATIWDETNTLHDLNDDIDPASDWYLYAATGIDDSGDIVGNGLFNGVPTGFLLSLGTGSISSSIQVPEPASAVLVLVIAPLLLRHRRNWRE